jgi:hypothetical protein
MPRFNVHLYPTVRVRVDAIDAVDHAAAAELARQRYYDAPDRFTRPGPEDGVLELLPYLSVVQAADEMSAEDRAFWPDAGDFEDAGDAIATALVDRIRESDGEHIGDDVDITFEDGKARMMRQVPNDDGQQLAFDSRELAAVLAGLRLYQAIAARFHNWSGDFNPCVVMIPAGGPTYADIGNIVTDGDRIEPLAAAEVDAFCYRLNVGPRLIPVSEIVPIANPED